MRSSRCLQTMNALSAYCGRETSLGRAHEQPRVQPGRDVAIGFGDTVHRTRCQRRWRLARELWNAVRVRWDDLEAALSRECLPWEWLLLHTHSTEGYWIRLRRHHDGPDDRRFGGDRDHHVERRLIQCRRLS